MTPIDGLVGFAGSKQPNACPECGHTSRLRSTCFHSGHECLDKRGQKVPCLCTHDSHFLAEGMTAGAETKTCPRCSRNTVSDHCVGSNYSHTCTWWLCRSCHAYGDNRAGRWT